MEREPLILLLIAVVTTGAAFVQNFIGFGYAIVALSLFSYVLDIRDANIIVTLSFLLPVIAGVWTYRQELPVTSLLVCLAGALCGLPIGLYIFSAVDALWLIRLSGLLIATLAIHGFFTSPSAENKPSDSWLGASLAGLASGLLAGAVGMGGPPVATFATRQSWSPDKIKGFLLTFLLLLGALRAAGLASAGWIGERSLVHAAVAIPFALAGGYLGVRASRKMAGSKFRRLTMACLFLLSLGMIFRTA